MTATHGLARSNTRRRVATATATIACAIGGLGLLGWGTASAAVVDASCPGTAKLDFTPGLKFMPRATSILVTATYPACVSTQVSSATIGGSGTGTMSCLGGTATVDMTFIWKQLNGAGAESRVLVSLAAVLGNGNVGLAASGTVVSGLFAGDAYSAAFGGVPFNPLACVSTTGATSVLGAGESTFIAP